MRKDRPSATRRPSATDLPPVFTCDPPYDDRHEAIELELLGIWMGISRLRQLVRCRPAIVADHRVLAWRRRSAKRTAERKHVPSKGAAHKRAAAKSIIKK
ncbi:MAG TPA: hypothetical protein VE224_13195 [Pseudolabrys sp.]|nr:hypothetical protein [Pseudolabrys sp.]